MIAPLRDKPRTQSMALTEGKWASWSMGDLFALPSYGQREPGLELQEPHLVSSLDSHHGFQALLSLVENLTLAKSPNLSKLLQLAIKEGHSSPSIVATEIIPGSKPSAQAPRSFGRLLWATTGDYYNWVSTGAGHHSKEYLINSAGDGKSWVMYKRLPKGGDI